MKFNFNNKESYIKGWEYLMRINEGFTCDPEEHIIEVYPEVDAEEVYARLTRICDHHENVDAKLAENIKRKN